MNKLEFNKRFWDTMSKSDTVNKNRVQAQVVSESAEVEGIAEFHSWAEKDTGVNKKSDTPQIESILGGLFDKKGDAEVFNGAKDSIAEIQIHRGETEDGVVVEEEEEVIEGHLNNDPKSSDVINESVEEEIKVFVELKSDDVVKVSDVTNMGNNAVNLSEMQTRECVSEDKLLPIGNYETLIYENGNNNNNNNKENIKGWNVNVCFQEKEEKFLEVLWNNYGICINKDAFWKELAKLDAMASEFANKQDFVTVESTKLLAKHDALTKELSDEITTLKLTHAGMPGNVQKLSHELCEVKQTKCNLSGTFEELTNKVDNPATKQKNQSNQFDSQRKILTKDLISWMSTKDEQISELADMKLQEEARKISTKLSKGSNRPDEMLDAELHKTTKKLNQDLETCGKAISEQFDEIKMELAKLKDAVNDYISVVPRTAENFVPRLDGQNTEDGEMI
ncbi:kinesin-related protein 8-like [Schistocerca piceifrons]|uniref:kinesin-related protein 8-like n=1 Tax=Schistocerca piceifrons TaxID=274613 RepID=UPI001F5FBDA7|nr:kinesin-related protein 8-like [Schistocerca piceifrons]